MPTALSPERQVSSHEPDELDRMLDYDNAVEDFLNDIPVRDGVGPHAAEETRDEDQEVQVKKKRKPIPKLDEDRFVQIKYMSVLKSTNISDRLLSDRGLPRLRKITKRQLKLRGKHHEFSDISKLLDTYQLWLDDLYPRAKFRDALTIVEKLGHSKRMQVMRKGWLDSTKPNRVESQSLEDEPALDLQETSQMDNGMADSSMPNIPAEAEATQLHSMREEDESHVPVTGENKGKSTDEPDEDELDMLLSENRVNKPSPVPRNNKQPFEDDDEEDELDAMLAEHDSRGRGSAPSRHDQSGLVATRDDFADEEDVMAEMGGMW